MWPASYFAVSYYAGSYWPPGGVFGPTRLFVEAFQVAGSDVLAGQFMDSIVEAGDFSGSFVVACEGADTIVETLETTGSIVEVGKLNGRVV